MEDLTNNEELQQMLTAFGNDPNSDVKINSIVQNKKSQRAIRVQNLQALIHERETRCSHSYKETCDCDSKQPAPQVSLNLSFTGYAANHTKKETYKSIN